MPNDTLVCLPTYNEAESVVQMIRAVHRVGLPVVVCDGYSTDGTPDLARSEGVTVLERSAFGKGAAIRTAMDHAHAQGHSFIAFLDCDCTYSVDDLRTMVDARESYDLVAGVRDYACITPARRFANHVMNAWFRLFFGPGFHDVASGLRVLRIDAYRNRLRADGFEVEPQFSAIAVLDGLRVLEVPITYADRVGESKVNWYHLLVLLYGMVHDRLTLGRRGR